MRSTIKRLFEIKEKPGMYIGRPSLTYLYYYISGYHHKAIEIGEDTSVLLPGFHEFIQERYQIKSHGWAQIILFYSSSEEKAFDRFFELLDEYWTMYPERAERP